MSSHKGFWKDDQLTCKPLDSYQEVLLFLENPPPWRSLCKDLTPHSKYLLRNIDVCSDKDFSLESPATFCHYDPDADDIQRHYEKELPKTLVCHDMANGYHDDSVIDGTGQFDAYTFYNWAGIDIFCYFSHHLVTIPPLAWINVGHAHGVKVIGTIITEWSDGVAFWDQILKSEEDYQNFANALVTVAKTLKFDGWLLNVENKISKPSVLLDFVKYFHRALHAELPAAALLWYDSVTATGELHWQNGLNDNNKDFFDACDGLFTNYSWAPRDVASSAAAAAAAAAGRLADLYVGVDVFGRNFYGGGQFNTQKAVRVARAAGCSLAVFAPAWTHEAMPAADEPADCEPGAPPSDRLERFILRDRAFWDSLWPLLNTRVPSQLPFKSSFCRGQGRKRWFYGEVLSPMPWYNLRHQQYQPNAAHGPHGYLLSTLGTLVRAARRAGAGRDTGVVDYRRAFLAAVAERAAHDDHPTDELTANCDDPTADLDYPPEDSTAARNDPAEGRDPQQSPTRVASSEGNGSVEKSGRQCISRSAKRKSTDAGGLLDKRSREAGAGAGWASGRSVHWLAGAARPGGAARAQWELAAVPGEAECLELHTADAFFGGACLRINPSDETDPTHRFTRLLLCDFRCRGSLVACVVTKTLSEFPQQTLDLVLDVQRAPGRRQRHTLGARAGPGGPAAGAVLPLDVTGARFRELQKYLLLSEPGFYVPVENSYHWDVRYYELPAGGGRVTSVSCRAGSSAGGVLLGYLGLCDRRG